MTQNVGRRSTTFHRPGHRRPGLRVVILAILAVTLSPIVPGGSPTASADELSDARSQQVRLQGKMAAHEVQVARLNKLQAGLGDEISTTRATLESINVDVALARRQVDRAEASIAIVEREYDGLVADLVQLDEELGQLQREQAEKRDELAERVDRLAQRIRDAYDADRTSLLEVLVSGASFTDVLAEVSYLVDVGQQDRQLAAQVERDREILATLEGSAETARDQTDRLRRETAAQKRKLDRRLTDLRSAQKELQQLERETERELVTQRAAYAELTKNEAALKKAIAAEAAAQKRLQARIASLVRTRQRQGKIPSNYNGTLIWPHAGRITQEFGCTGFPWEPPLGNCANFHRGIDIAAPRWTPVRAAADGVVVFAGPNPYDPYPKAWIVIIAHSASLQTWYAHVDDQRPPTVRAGESVKQGQIIAYVGSTGRSTGNHTDWRVELRGAFVNPRLFL